VRELGRHSQSRQMWPLPAKNLWAKKDDSQKKTAGKNNYTMFILHLGRRSTVMENLGVLLNGFSRKPKY
jgi:hypothetical protein